MLSTEGRDGSASDNEHKLHTNLATDGGISCRCRIPLTVYSAKCVSVSVNSEVQQLMPYGGNTLSLCRFWQFANAPEAIFIDRD